MVLLSESSSSESKVYKNKKSKKLKKEKAKKSFIEKLKSFFKKPKNTVRYVACNVLNRKGKGPKFCQDIEDPTDPEDPVDPEEPVDPVNPEEPVDPVNPVIPLSGVGTYVYNASGELIRLEAAEGNTVFSRGELGVIDSVTLPSSQSINYKTDYNARRVEKLNSLSQNYRRIYQSQLQVAAQMNGSELSEYIYATKINVPELIRKDGQTYRVITDHLGSPVLVINTADGTIESQAQYNEWGRVIEETNTGLPPFNEVLVMKISSKLKMKYKSVLLFSGAMFIISICSSYYFLASLDTSPQIEFLLFVGFPGLFLGVFFIYYEKYFKIRSQDGKVVLIAASTVKMLKLELAKSNVHIKKRSLTVGGVHKFDLDIVNIFKDKARLSHDDFLKILPDDVVEVENTSKLIRGMGFSKIVILVLFIIFLYVYVFISPSF